MQIWVVNADGTNNHAVFMLGNALAPSWSPDGSRIAFAHKTNVADGFKIWVMDADGTKAHALTSGTMPAVDENVPRWSPDRQHLVFTSNASGLYEIWVADVATGADRRALTHAYHDAALAANIEQKVPAWSPDGRIIAYWSGVEGTDPRPNLPRDVWVMNADGTGQRKVVSGDDPNWSPDAQTIIHSLGSPSGPVLGAVAPDGSNARTLYGVIGVGFIPEVLNRSILDEVIAVTDEEAFSCARRLAREEGIMAGVLSGAALHVALAVAARKDAVGKMIVVVLADTGERYVTTTTRNRHQTVTDWAEAQGSGAELVGVSECPS